MTSRDFCYWLQGFFEISGMGCTVDARQTQIIKNHLAMVFKHEIDPSHGDEAHHKRLQAVHDAISAFDPKNPDTFPKMNC